jgi:Carboxypeptidase regulatory-like domain
MKLLITTVGLCCMWLTACSKNPQSADLAKEGITVCGTVLDDNHQPLANAFIELHRSAKDPSVVQSRYQVGRTDDKGQFQVQGVPQGQYWLAVVPKGPCSPKSKDENEARRAQVDVPNGTPGLECKTHWQVAEDASCKVIVQ